MRTAVLLFSLLLFTTIAKAQIDWQHCYGGTNDDKCNAIRATFDGGYVLAGYATSNNDDVHGNHGGEDFWVVKITAVGDTQWEKCYGGSNIDEAWDIRQTVDSGYVVAGYTYSNDGDVSGNHGDADIWVIKLSSNGLLQWQKCLGGSGKEWAENYYSAGSGAVCQTSDGGYIVAGLSMSNDGDVSGNHGATDVWVVRLTDTGSIVWAKCYGGSSNDYVNSIQQTFDGGYIFGSYSYSNDGNITGHHGDTTFSDIWVVKLADSGDIQWETTLGGSKYEYGGNVMQTKDTGYLVCGGTNSDDGDITCYTGGGIESGIGWMIKLADTGSTQWTQCIDILGGDGGICINSEAQTADGGYIIGGDSWPFFIQNGKALFGKVSNVGYVEWLDTLGGNSTYGETSFSSVALAGDGTGIATGYTNENNGDVAGNHGWFDFWVAKFGWHTNVPIVAGYGLTLAPNPADHYLSITAENEITSITITNIMGQVVYTYGGSGQNATANSGRLVIDVHDWQAGLYFVQINGVVATKFVKE